MSRKRKAITAGFLILQMFGPLHASSDLGRIFAGCAGRFSAEMEHAWLVNDDRADHFQDRRATFVSLLDATLADEDRRRILAYRIDTKLAHAALLQSASFGQDSTYAANARLLADDYLLSCNRLLLDS